MAVYSCTNQQYEFAPLRVEIIDYIPVGTILYHPSGTRVPAGNPFLFSFDPTLFPYPSRFVTRFNIPYMEGLPEGNPIDGLCYECRPDQVFCYTEDLETSIPHPCAWWQDPFLYLCNLNLLSGPV